MSASTIIPGTPQHATWETSSDDAIVPAKGRALFARLRQWFAFSDTTAWASSLQPEHLFASMTQDETLVDSEDGSLDSARRIDR